MSLIKCFECRYEGDEDLDKFLTSSGCCPGCGTRNYRIAQDMQWRN